MNVQSKPVHLLDRVSDHVKEVIILYWMALRRIQEYIARDVNNIARVEDEGNIVSIEGNIFLYPPKKSHPILLSLFIQGFVCHLTI